MRSWFPLADHSKLPASAGIYVIRHIESGKQYVGQSLNVRKRAKSHAWADPKHYLGRAIRAHGVVAFEICLWSFCAAEDLGHAECVVIAELGTRAPAGYNLSDGGLGPAGVEWSDERKAQQSARVAGVPLAAETKEKMSAAALRNNPFKGRTHSAETRAKIGEANVRIHTGRKRSDETKAKISAAKKGCAAPYVSPEARARGAEKRRGVPNPGSSQPGEKNGMFGVRGGAHPRAKPIAVWEPEAMIPRVFESAVEAAEYLGVDRAKVSDFLAGRRKAPGGRAVCLA